MANFKNYTPEQRSEMARKAAATRAHNNRPIYTTAAALGDSTQWVKAPVFTVQLVRDSSTPLAERKQIQSPASAASILLPYMAGLDRENLVVLLLDTRNRVIGINTVAIGNLNSAVVDFKQILKPAILTNAAGIIIAHNHPSGDPDPSPEDVAVTRNLNKVCKLLDIELLDHMVIGEDGRFTSLRERGLSGLGE